MIIVAAVIASLGAVMDAGHNAAAAAKTMGAWMWKCCYCGTLSDRICQCRNCGASQSIKVKV